MKDTTVTYHISYLVFDDCMVMVRWCRNSLIKHQEPRARSRHYEQWVDIQYLQFRTISTQYLHSIYTTQYPAETRQLLNSSWGYWREEAREQTDKIFMKVHRISKNLTLHCVYLRHTQIGSGNASKRGPLTQVPWSRQNWNACSGLIVGGWFYWTFLAFHSGARCWAPDDHNISAKSPGYKPSELTFSQPAQWQTAYLCEPIWTWFLAKLGVLNWTAS